MCCWEIFSQCRLNFCLILCDVIGQVVKLLVDVVAKFVGYQSFLEVPFRQIGLYKLYGLLTVELGEFKDPKFNSTF